MRVTTADFIAHYGALADRALLAPLITTHNSQGKMVVTSDVEYERLTRRDRHVVRAGELSDEEVALIAGVEAPTEYVDVDQELTHWRPGVGLTQTSDLPSSVTILGSKWRN